MFYSLQLRIFVVALLLLAVPSCAAMRRTWQFHADPAVLVQADRAGVQADPAAAPVGFEVRVASAAVSQHRVALQLTLHNTGPQPLAVQCENASLTLPDGEVFTSTVGNIQSDVARGLAAIGIGKGKDPLTIAPGASASLELSISQGRRDLRRFPKLLIQFTDLKLDGRAVTLPPLVLAAPPEAPIGEDI